MSGTLKRKENFPLTVIENKETNKRFNLFKIFKILIPKKSLKSIKEKEIKKAYEEKYNEVYFKTKKEDQIKQAETKAKKDAIKESGIKAIIKELLGQK